MIKKRGYTLPIFQIIVGGLVFALPLFCLANTNTGADSTNTETNTATTETIVNNNNTAWIKNISLIEAITGRNNTGYNTGTGLITTDDANVSGDIVNIVNKNTYSLGSYPGANLAGGNENTGANSENYVSNIENNDITIKNTNWTETINNITAKVISGDNKSEANTGHGIVMSGQANMGLDMITLGNTNIFGSNLMQVDWLNVFNNYIGNLVFSDSTANDPLAQIILEASNKSTGAESVNQAISQINNNISITNINEGQLNNEVLAEVVSGRNQANKNTGSGVVSSGDANADLNLINFLNSNVYASNWWLKTLNVFGNWTGDLVLPTMLKQTFTNDISAICSSSNTGADSVNECWARYNRVFELNNNNEAEIKNSVALNADTGHNQANYNLRSGEGKTGQTRAEVNQTNIANVNITGDTWWILIINVFDTWNGQIRNAPSNAQMAMGQHTIILTPNGSGIEVKNSSTGAGSQNTAGADINDMINIVNQNKARIYNKVNIDAITGQNKANYNSGQGNIETGDVEAVTNLINFANSNIAVGNWLVGVVNVFGTWNGNIIFPSSMPASQLIVTNNLLASANASNGSTGAGSTNTVANSNTTTNQINNNNTVEVTNNTSASSSTGSNSSSYNTGNGVVATGEASTASSLGNEANANNTSVGQSAGPDGAATNQSTGAGSTNTSTTSTDTNNAVNNNNTTTANNNYSGSSSTGSSASSFNTGNGSVSTGNSSTGIDLWNQFNSNGFDFGSLFQQATNNQNNTDSQNSGTAQNGDGTNTSSSGSAIDSGTNTTQNNNQTTDNTNNSQIENQALNNNKQETGASSQNNTTNQINNTATNTNNANTNNNSTNNTSQTTNNQTANQNNTTQNTANNTTNKGVGGGGGGATTTINNPLGQKPGSQPNATNGSLNGDIDASGSIDDFDFSILMANWGQYFKDLRADLNKDNKVDDFDFSIVMANWGKKI